MLDRRDQVVLATQVVIVLVLALVLVPSAGAKLAFVATAEGNWELFVADDDGRNVERLTHTPYDEKEPSWFPDKGRIAYATSDGSLNVIDIATKEAVKIPAGEASRPKINPAVSPDGRFIAFAQQRPPAEGDDTDLMIYEVESKRTRKLIEQPSIQAWPAWSPDGKKLVYSNQHCSSACGMVLHELWVTRPDEQWARQLIMLNSYSIMASWSPEGNRLAYASGQSGNMDVWMLTLGNQERIQITNHAGLDTDPTWSDDGGKLAYISTASGRLGLSIYDLDRKTTTPVALFSDPNVDVKDVAW